MAAEKNELLEEQIRALMTERSFYKQRGESTAAVDAELKRLGAKGEAPAKRAATRKKG